MLHYRPPANIQFNSIATMSLCSADWGHGPYGVTRTYSCSTKPLLSPCRVYIYLPPGLEMTQARLRRGSGANPRYLGRIRSCRPADLRPRPAHWVLLTGLARAPASSGTFRVRAAVRGCGGLAGLLSLQDGPVSARRSTPGLAKEGRGIVGC
jgi:hypothetical protein